VPGVETSRVEPAGHAIASLLSGVIASALGLTALVGWLLDNRLLTGFGSSSVPMAPSTALLFIAHGLVLALRARQMSGRRTVVSSGAVAGISAVVALALLVLSMLGIRSPIEHLGMGIAGHVNGVPLGHMSPATACGFLLASLSLALSLRPFSSRSVRRRAAMVSAASVLVASLVFLLAYLYGKPLLQEGGFIPPALNTTLAFAALGAGSLIATRRLEAIPAEPHRPTRAATWFILVYTAFAAGLVATGYYYHQGYEKHFRGEVDQHLSAIADLKVSELTQWRRERIGDGTVFLRNEDFSRLVQACLDRPDDRQSCERLEIWLRQFRDSFRYDRVFVVDTAGVQVASVPGVPEPVCTDLQAALPSALQSRQVTFLDLHLAESNSAVRLSILVPIMTPQKNDRPLGVLVLRVDPAMHLDPIIQRWPAPSRTAETLLVRREGDHALFLNDLRFRDDAALSLRAPLSDERIPAVRAALGRHEVAEGVDYRGVKVIAVTRSVPDSPWALVARIDAAEVYAPMNARLWLTVLLVAALLAGSGTSLVLLWRQQSMRFFRDRYEAAEALRESEARYRALLEYAPVAVFINRNDRVIEANLACLRLFGMSSKQQVLGKSPYELFHPDCHDAVRDRIRLLRERGEAVPLLGERIVRLDGTPVEVEVSAAPFMDRGVNAIHVVLSDITDRKKAEQALRASETELRHRNEELTRFTYTVSHDLKSPLVTIQTFLGYLEQDLAKNDPASIEKDVGFMRAAAHKMSRLLQELLELSRVGRVKHPSVDVSLQEVVQEALSLVAGRIAQRGAQVRVTDEPIMLHGDRVRLVEVFQNLVDNAMKFMGEQAAPLVEIGAEQADGELALFVRDNGAGIDARHAGKLFGLFEKLDPKSEGTGIGLALVRRIVEVHGGRIWVESEGSGRGACFRFTLAGTTRAPRKSIP